MDPAALGALLAGIGGFITAVVGFRKAKRESATDCHEQLRAARAEAEELNAELHRYRMHNDDGRALWWMLASLALFIICVIFAVFARDPGHGPPGPPGPIG